MAGTIHKVSAKYLPLYVAEFQFRYNNRENAGIFRGSDWSMPEWARKHAAWLIGALSIGVLVLGLWSISIPIPLVEHHACVQAAQAEKQDKRDCKLQETLWDRTLSDPISFYTLLLTVFTGALAIVGFAQWSLISRQIDLATKEFIATHRPRLHLRSVYFDGISDDEFLPAFITVVNVGESNATVVGVNAKFVVKAGAEWIEGIPDIKAVNAPPENIFIPGKRTTWAMIDRRKLKPGEAEAIRRDAKQLWAIGEIVYEDDNRIARQTGFAWRYAHPYGVFLPVEEEKTYNYED